MFTREFPAVSKERARDFLRKRTRSEFLANVSGAVLSLAGAALVFGVITWFSAAGAFLFATKVAHAWLWITVGVIAFSFIAYAFTDPEYLSKLEVRTVDGRAAYHIQLPGGWSLSNVNYFSPKTQQAIARMILQFISSGPRALVASWRYAIRAIAARKIDPESIASMFKLLVERGKRASYEELAGLAMREPEKAFADLLLLDVVQHLPTPPEGMVITSKIREAVTGIKTDGTDF